MTAFKIIFFQFILMLFLLFGDNNRTESIVLLVGIFVLMGIADILIKL